jgi:hypothetical protein
MAHLVGTIGRTAQAKTGDRSVGVTIECAQVDSHS